MMISIKSGAIFGMLKLSDVIGIGARAKEISLQKFANINK